MVRYISSKNIHFSLALVIFTSLSVYCQTLSEPEVDSLTQITLSGTNDSIRGRAYNKLAFHYVFQDADKARSLIEKGLKEAEDHHLLFGKAELLNTKASYYDISGARDSAEMLFLQSLAISQTNGYRNIEVMTRNSLGLLYWKTGNFEKALIYFFDALKMNEDFFPEHNDSRANYLSNIGLIYQDLRQFPKAIYYHQEALKIREELRLSNGIAISYANLGVCYKSQNSYDTSETFFIRAIQKAKEAENWWMYHSLYNNLGQLYMQTNRNDSAIAAFRIALQKPESITANPKGDLSIYTNLTSIYKQNRQPKQALVYAAEGLELLHEYPHLFPFAEELFFASAESHFMLGNLEEGRAFLQKYRSVVDSTFTQQNALALAEVEEKYKSAQKDKMVLEQQQIIQQKELELRKHANWLILSASIFILALGILFILFKRKQLLAEQAALELKLAEEKERNLIQEERLRISRELHDHIGSYLTLIHASVEQIPEMTPNELDSGLPEIQKTLSLCTRELRKTVWLLNNQEITIETLVLRIREFFRPIGQTKTRIQIEAKGNTDKKLSDIQATHLFRVLQEAVNNAYKHAFAKQIQIEMEVNERVNLSVTDDGKGFNPSQVESGNGLQNMQVRMSELRGEIGIESEPGKGTRLYAWFIP